jgi:hypothetical protein
MNKGAIPRGLCLTLLAAAAHAQTVAAGARAVVSSDTLSVYATMSESGDVRVTLKRGDAVTIGLVLFGTDTTWCAVSKAGETKRLGFASCESLEPDRGGAAAAPAPTPPTPVAAAPVAPAPTPAPAAPAPPPVTPAPVAKAKPVTIEQTPPIAITVREPVPAPVPSTPAEPPPAPSVPTDFIEALLDGSGLRASLANYTQTTHLLTFLDKSRLAEIDVPALERVLAAQFHPEAFYSAIGSQARKNYSLERMAALAEWLRAPVTNKLADLERRSFTPEAREELVAFAGSMGSAPPPQTRLVLLHRLYDAARTCDLEVEATIALVHTIAQAIGPALPKEKRYTGAELDRALGAVKSRYRSVMKNARIVHYLFAYQSATDEELEQYVNFLESDSGKWLISLIDKGFFEATGAIARGLSSDIPRNVKPKRHLPNQNTGKGLLP